MNAEQIRDISDRDLRAQLLELQQEAMHLRMGNAIGTSESPVVIRQKRRDIARIKTILRERQLVKQ